MVRDDVDRNAAQDPRRRLNQVNVPFRVFLMTDTFRGVSQKIAIAFRGSAAILLRHALVLLLFAALAIAWTWPLVRHLRDALPGNPGDNYSFVWNLWWMRQVLSTPGLEYFHTNYLFYPFGTTIADHPHTALPAFTAATLLGSASAATAQNILLVLYVFANLASMYALAWSLTRQHLPSILAGVIFGISPYVAVHLLGHFDLVAAWPLPLYALLLNRAVTNRSIRSAIGAGVVLGATAYIAYYYVVFLSAFTLVYVLVASRVVRLARSQSGATGALRAGPIGFLAVACVAMVFAVVIAISGGGVFYVGPIQISARTPQNALSLMWLAILLWALVKWRPVFAIDVRSPAFRHALFVAACVSAAFVLIAVPLLWQAMHLIVRHEYVTQRYYWRSVPRGVDLLAPLLGHPLHPLFGSRSASAYSSIHADYIESIGWLGITPVVLLALTYGASARDDGVRIWRSVAIVFGIWAFGPFLTIGGFDTGLRLPVILFRYVPFVANARMPGRAIVIVYMAVALLIARGLSAASGRLRSPAMHWMLIALIVFEYWQAPISLTTLDYPLVYRTLASAEPGAVCEVPFGIGDGLGGVGQQDRSVLFHATQHEHPLVGGYIGRMPVDAASRYGGMPVVGNLLALSSGDPLRNALSTSDEAASSPCRYVVVHRSRSPSVLLDYVKSLRPTLIASSADDELYRLPR
jgi:hypothetical protein